METNHQNIVGLLVVALGVVSGSEARTILVPEEARTIKVAVDMAMSGDRILFSTTSVIWGGSEIKITNKDLEFMGLYPNRQTTVYNPAITDYSSLNNTSNLLWIENSEVTLRNIKIEPPPISRLWNNHVFSLLSRR